MKVSRILIWVSLAVAILIPSFSYAQSNTDLQAQITALLAKLTALQAQLKQQQGGQVSCHNFLTNLRVGDQGSEIQALQSILQKEGFNISQDETNSSQYGEGTAAAVSGFQEKYNGDVLTPNGLKYGTGFAGVSTRNKLNKLYGCGITAPTTPSAQPLYPQTSAPSMTTTTGPIISGASGSTISNVGELGSANNLPDTTYGAHHVAMTFNYRIYPSLIQNEVGKVDFVWGAESGDPASVYNTYYIPFDRDKSITSSTIAWMLKVHPDWVEYQCPVSGQAPQIAYEFGDLNLPLDITNQNVRDYIFNTYILPASQRGYEGIAFDNVSFNNYGSRCGHFDTSGNWISQFNGTGNDQAYHNAVINWASWMYSKIHSLGMTSTMNFWFDPRGLSTSRADSYKLFQYMDADFDECGVACYAGNPSGYVAWKDLIEAYQYLADHGQGLIMNDLTASTRDQIQWALANYLLVKGAHTYINITTESQYGSLNLLPEYDAPMGTATAKYYQSQGVYMRDYSGGLAIVNPSPTQSFTVTLAANAYKDLYGGAIGTSVTLAPLSGVVFLKTQAPATSPSLPTATLTANGLSNLTLNVGDAVNYAWNSSNGTSWSATYTSDSPQCGLGAGPNLWIATSSSGSRSMTIPSCEAGHTYHLTYTATNSAGSQSAYINLNIFGFQGP